MLQINLNYLVTLQHITKNILLLICSISLTLIAIEGISRCIYTHESLRIQRIGRAEWLKSQPQAYKNEPYIITLIDKADTVYQVPKMSAKATRNTCFQPKNLNKLPETLQITPIKTVYIFGGSTIFGLMVPDSLTIPSHLQKYYQQQFPNQFRVVNMGILGMSSGAEVQKLQEVKLQKGDIVIFYDGINDVIKTCVQEKITPKQTIKNDDKIEKFKEKLTKVIFLFSEKIYQRFATYSVFIDWQFYPYKANPLMSYWYDEEQVTKTLAILEQNYIKNIETAFQICNKQQAIFHHFLHPILYSEPPEKWSSYEQFMANNIHLSGGLNIQKACILGYPHLQNCIKTLKQQGVPSIDLSQSFVANKQEVYWDFCHLSGFGNELMAKKIAKILQLSK